MIDPRYSRTAAKADWWIPIRPGTDAALALGMMHVIFKEDLHDKDYISKDTVGPFLVRTDTGKFVREKDLGGNSEDYIVWDANSNSAVKVQNSASPAITGSYTLTLNGRQVTCKPAFQLLVEEAEKYTPEKASEITEVPAEDIRKLAFMYAKTDPLRSRYLKEYSVIIKDIFFQGNHHTRGSLRRYRKRHREVRGQAAHCLK